MDVQKNVRTNVSTHEIVRAVGIWSISNHGFRSFLYKTLIFYIALNLRYLTPINTCQFDPETGMLFKNGIRIANMNRCDRFGTTASIKESERDKVVPVFTLTIASHPDLNRIGNMFRLHGRGARLSRLTPDFIAPRGKIGKPLDDPFLSREPIKLKKTANGVLLQSNNKTELWAGDVQITDEHFLSASEIEQGVVLVLAKRMVLVAHYSLPEEAFFEEDYGLVGHSNAINHLRSEIKRVADLNMSVLLRGQSGSGKELAARAIHHASSRKGPFISINMGAIPPTLAASELFGAIKGSFTGSDRHQSGYFLEAQNGTLFLDEIGETPPEVQVLLLRTLETGEIYPLGAQKGIPVNVRYLAATDADLEDKMVTGSFKQPLFHRLAGYEINLPELRRRPEDIGRLFCFFARQILEEIGETRPLRQKDPYAEPWIPAQIMARLCGYHWPGNVRQLRNMVRQLIVGSRGEPRLKMVPRVAEILKQEEQTLEENPVTAVRSIKPSSLSDDQIKTAMREHGWRIRLAARALGISRGALYQRIDKIPDLRKAADLDAPAILDALEKVGGDLEAAADILEVSARALRRRVNQLGLAI